MMVHFEKKEHLVRYLKRINYWWETKKILKEDIGIPRNTYLNRIKTYLNLDRIICLTGIRRSGKTTLLYQIADFLITQGLPPTKVVYLKIDDIFEKIDDLRILEDVYMELFGTDIKREKVYFLIDEIQFLKNWQTQIKYFIDFKYKSKFILSGSSRTLLFKDSSESLVGRILFVDIFPLTFKEFLFFNKISVNNFHFDFQNNDIDSLRKLYFSFIEKQSILKNFLKKYIEVGGFPEWFKVKNKVLWYRILSEDYFTLTLTKDILILFNPRDPSLLFKLAREIALLSTERISYLNLSNRLDSNKDTVKQYVHYLRSSLLLFIAEKYTKRKVSQERSPKKIFFWEEGMRRAIVPIHDDSKSIENIVAWHLIKRGISENSLFVPYYWKNKYEIDFVYEDITKNIVVPIEIKYRGTIKRMHKGFLEFYKNVKPFDYAIVVTKDYFGFLENENIPFKVFYIPAWLFLILLS